MRVKSYVSKLANSPSTLNILYLPVEILLCTFIFFPFIRGVVVSFTDWNGFSQNYSFVGLLQYKKLFSDIIVLHTIINTFIYAFVSTFFQNLLGLCYALLLDKAIKGRNIVRAIIYLPAMISGLIMGYIWYFMFQTNGGAINDIVVALGHSPLNFLGSGIVTVFLITAVNIFQHCGGCMLIYLAGLQTVPRDYYEAASLDGAKGFTMFRTITLPLIIPSITINVILNLIGGLKLFDVIIAMTNGGPGNETQSLSTMMYQLYFSYLNAGYAATLGVFMFLIIIIISMTALVLLRRREVEY